MKPFGIAEVRAIFWKTTDYLCSNSVIDEVWPIAFTNARTDEARVPLLAGLSSLEIALPAAAEGAITAAAVDDGLAADEEVGDAL